MRAPKLIETREVALADIVVGERLRPVGEVALESLISSIETLGAIKDPIDLRRVKHRNGELRLIAGGHRVEAALRLGFETIPAKVWDCTDLWARLTEIDDNLAHAELDALEMATFLAERKAVYEEMHPETKAGVFKGNQHTERVVTELSSATRNRPADSQTELSSFCQTVAEKRGISDRQVRKIVQAGEALTPGQVEALRGGERRPSLKDLLDLAKEHDEATRDAACVGFAADPKLKMSAALEAARGTPKPPADPVDGAFRRLVMQWTRAPKAAKRRFVDECFGELEAAGLDIFTREAAE